MIPVPANDPFANMSDHDSQFDEPSGPSLFSVVTGGLASMGSSLANSWAMNENANTVPDVDSHGNAVSYGQSNTLNFQNNEIGQDRMCDSQVPVTRDSQVPVTRCTIAQ